jgi:hypothetical protein
MTKGHHASAAGLGSDLRAERHYSIHGDSTDVNIVPRTSPDPQVQRSVTDRSDYLKALAPADKMTVSAGLIDVMAASDNHEEAVLLALCDSNRSVRTAAAGCIAAFARAEFSDRGSGWPSLPHKLEQLCTSGIAAHAVGATTCLQILSEDCAVSSRSTGSSATRRTASSSWRA